MQLESFTATIKFHQEREQCISRAPAVLGEALRVRNACEISGALATSNLISIGLKNTFWHSLIQRHRGHRHGLLT
jgi:hypothetical protein